MSVDKSVELRKSQILGRTMILSYKLYTNIPLEPVKVDIRRTETENKTALNPNLQTRSWVAFQMSQVETGIIFLFMNVMNVMDALTAIFSETVIQICLTIMQNYNVMVSLKIEVVSN